MSTIEIINKLWAPLVGTIGLIAILAKSQHRITVLEDKVKVLFSLYNKDKP